MPGGELRISLAGGTADTRAGVDTMLRALAYTVSASASAIGATTVALSGAGANISCGSPTLLHLLTLGGVRGAESARRLLAAEDALVFLLVLMPKTKPGSGAEAAC